jgi:hypothetical protein
MRKEDRCLSIEKVANISAVNGSTAADGSIGSPWEVKKRDNGPKCFTQTPLS